jgi:hypothetical protein
MGCFCGDRVGSVCGDRVGRFYGDRMHQSGILFHFD